MRERGQVLIDYAYVLANPGRIADARDRTADAVAALESREERGALAHALAGAVITRYLSGGGLDETTRLRVWTWSSRNSLGR